MNIKIIYTKIHVGDNPPYEIYDGVREPYAEKPERLLAIVKIPRENVIKTL